jgi:colicin import membrane protein
MSSEYEQNVGTLLAEKMEKLEELEKNPDAKNDQKKILMSEIETLQSLFENYNLGMNYFRRARGGRTGLREYLISFSVSVMCVINWFFPIHLKSNNYLYSEKLIK